MENNRYSSNKIEL